MVTCYGKMWIKHCERIKQYRRYYEIIWFPITIAPTFPSILVPVLMIGIMQLNHMVTVTRDTYSNCLVLTDLLSPSINISNIQCGVLLEIWGDHEVKSIKQYCFIFTALCSHRPTATPHTTTPTDRLVH